MEKHRKNCECWTICVSLQRHAHLLFYCRLDQMAYRVVKYVEANKLNMVLQYINYVWAVPISFHTFLIVFIVVVVSTKTTVVHGKLTVRVTGVQPRI